MPIHFWVPSSTVSLWAFLTWTSGQACGLGFLLLLHPECSSLLFSWLKTPRLLLEIHTSRPVLVSSHQDSHLCPSKPSGASPISEMLWWSLACTSHLAWTRCNLGFSEGPHIHRLLSQEMDNQGQPMGLFLEIQVRKFQASICQAWHHRAGEVNVSRRLAESQGAGQQTLEGKRDAALSEGSGWNSRSKSGSGMG